MALEQILSVQMEKNTDKILSEVMSVAGIWADRDDIGDTVEYVRNLRKGTAERLKRLGIWNDSKFHSAN